MATPGGQAVNRPTNVQQKEQDINNKLQLYGTLTAFANGKVPSNEQIDVAMNTFQRQSFMTNPPNKLSTDGQGLVADFKDVVNQAKYMLLTKNEGNLLQDFIWQTQQIDGGNALAPNAPVDAETAKQHGNQALDGIRTLGTLIITNGQFRKLLNDATILLRDVAGDAAQKAATKINPSDDDLAQIDRPAEDNTWHDAPDLSGSTIKSQLKDTFNKNAPVNVEDVRDAAGDATQAAHPDGSRDPADVARQGAQDQYQGTNSGVDAKGGIQSGINTLRDRMDDDTGDRVEDTKNQLRDTKDATKQKAQNYWNDKMPQERRDQTTYRLKKMIVEIQDHPDYMSAINTLLDLAETYAGHANNVAHQTAGSVQAAHEDSALTRAEADLKTLIERFANNTSTDDLWDSINQMYLDADRDPELKGWFKQIDAYIRKCLQQKGYVLEDRSTNEWNEIYDRGNFLLRDRYRNHTDRITDELNFLADQFNRDQHNRRFADACRKLFNDLGNDENGRPTFKPHLIKDLTDVILPAAFEKIRYVPIPRIEYSDPMIDAVVENLVIESDNLMPNAVEFASDNYFRWGRKNIANRNKNSVMISVSGVQMDLKDVSYYVKKKQGFPGITDLGLADIFLGGSGLSFKIKMSTADSNDRQNFFKVDNVDVDVKNFNITLKESRHKFLFGLFKPIMLGVMRPALQKIAEKVIKDQINQLDGMAYAVQQEANRAKDEAQKDPSNVPNIYNRYANAAQNKFMKGKKKAQKAAADKKVNVAMTQHDSIFPNIKLPGGISSKATEYKELALKGDKWQSPIFSIGSASRTTDIPSAGQITRKQHDVTRGSVRGPQNVGQTESMSNQIRDEEAMNRTQRSTGLNGSANTTSGYGNTTSGYGNTTSGYGNTTSDSNTAGFSNQVDQAFSKGNTVPQNGTTLGQNNPVFTGNTQTY